MKKPDDKQRLEHIIEAVEKIQTYVQKINKAEFLNDEKTTSAVNWQLAIIGESVANLTDTLRKNNPQVIWHKISGTRNHLIHGYFTIDFEIVWATIQNDLPQLKIEIEKILEELNK
jgi:uncharacterized protein with HEPN domain